MNAPSILDPTTPWRRDQDRPCHPLQHIPGAVALVTFGPSHRRCALTAHSIVPLPSEPFGLFLCLDLDKASEMDRPLHPRLGGEESLASSDAKRADIAVDSSIGVSILAGHQGIIAETFRKRQRLIEPGTFTGVNWRTFGDGALVVEDAVLCLGVRVEARHERKGQTVVMGTVEALHSNEGASVLVQWRGAYDSIGWTEAEIARATGPRG